MEPQLVTIAVSDPWEFLDENEGRLGFVATIVGVANGKWLLNLRTPVIYQGWTWHFAIVTPRFVGQLGFETNRRSEHPLYHGRSSFSSRFSPYLRQSRTAFDSVGNWFVRDRGFSDRGEAIRTRNLDGVGLPASPAPSAPLHGIAQARPRRAARSGLALHAA
jgi:hypothetical protein